MPGTDPTRPGASDAVPDPFADFPAAADLQLLDEARRQLDQERAERALVGAVDELATAAEAFTVAYLRGEPTTGPVLNAVLSSVFDLMAAHRQMGGAS